MAEMAEHGFTPEQIAWLEKRFDARHPATDRSFDRATLMWIIGGLTGLGVAVSGVLYAEIGSVRGEIGSVRGEINSVRGEINSVRGEIALVRDQVQTNTAALARIEAILEERLPRGE